MLTRLVSRAAISRATDAVSAASIIQRRTLEAHRLRSPAKRNMAGFTAANQMDTASMNFLDEVHQRITAGLLEEADRESKVVNFVQPEELKSQCRPITIKMYLFLNDYAPKQHTTYRHSTRGLFVSTPDRFYSKLEHSAGYKNIFHDIIGLDVGPEGLDQEALLSICDRVLKYSVRTGHPHFYNQLYSGKSAVGLAGAWLTDSLNTNLHTFEVAPVFVLVEKYVIQKLCELLGYADGDGTFTPGGSFGNLMGIHLARYKFDKHLKEKGLFNCPRMAIFTSEGCHYSMFKAASFLGFGTENVITVNSDDRGKMCPKDFEQKVLECKAKGLVPLVCNATLGTTVLGAFDPVDELADICEKYNIWLHVDMAWGGGGIFSDKQRHLFKGIERTDSALWSLHKMLGAPIQCAVILVKQQGILQECNGLKASYLFQPDKIYDTSYDVGDKTIQCGKHSDSFKFWLMWKAFGNQGFADHVDNMYNKAAYLTEKLRGREGFKLVIPEFECTNVSFWYVPPSLRNKPETSEWWAEIGKVAPKIKAKMMLQGTMLIGYNPLPEKNFVNFFRIIMANNKLTNEHMDYVLNEIERLGNDL